MGGDNKLFRGIVFIPSTVMIHVRAYHSIWHLVKLMIKLGKEKVVAEVMGLIFLWDV